MKSVLLFAVAAMVGFSARAEDKSSGCGLGWAVTKKISLFSSTTRTSTNMTGSQTFAMSSGTSGCASHSIVKNERAAEHYAEANYNHLMLDMAHGQGEHLQAFASTLGCPAHTMGDFGAMTRKNYSELFPSEKTQPMEMLDRVRERMNRDTTLSTACTGLLG